MKNLKLNWVFYDFEEFHKLNFPKTTL